MTFTCYRFPSQAVFRTLAAAEGLIVTAEDGTEILRTADHGWALDEVGLLYSGGTYDPTTGEALDPPIALDGWHINTVGLAPEAWDEFLCIVNRARRIFSGGPTQAPDTATLEAMAE
jgi:hypothetical protein